MFLYDFSSSTPNKRVLFCALIRFVTYFMINSLIFYKTTLSYTIKRQIIEKNQVRKNNINERMFDLFFSYDSKPRKN